jgi:hypothetical protein
MTAGTASNDPTIQTPLIPHMQFTCSPRYIGKFQNPNGVFRRAANPGISHLENAFYALNAFLEFARRDIQ